MNWTIVFFLSPHRLGAEISDISEVLGEQREAALLAELSKRHERIEFGTPAELVHGREVQNPRGEYVLVVGPRKQPENSANAKPKDVSEAYRAAIESGMQRREAQRLVAQEFGISRRDVYSMLIGQKES